MRILITGSRGFLGSTFAAFATAQGHDVLGLGRTAQPPPGWPGQYAWTDVAHADLSPLVNGFRPDLVFHGAGSASVGGSFQSPLDDLRASVYTFANTLEGIRRSEHRPVVLFPSSAAVYGHPSRLPVNEDDPTHPISPYGFHKLAAEQLGREYAACYGLRVVLGRIFSVLGPRQRRLLLWELFEQFTGPDSRRDPRRHRRGNARLPLRGRRGRHLPAPGRDLPAAQPKAANAWRSTSAPGWKPPCAN